MYPEFIALPVMGALIGWFTNLLAIRMIFHPRKPVRLPFAPVVLQGVLPRRRHELARTVALAIEENLVSAGELMETIDFSRLRKEVIEVVGKHVDGRLQELVPGILPDKLRTYLSTRVSEVVARETKIVLDDLEKHVRDNLKEEIHLAELVRHKLESFDLKELESLVMRIAGTELRHIEILGGVLGLVIGLVQAALVRLFYV